MARNEGMDLYLLGTPVVPFFPFYLGVSFVKLNRRKTGTLSIKGLLGNLANSSPYIAHCFFCFRSFPANGR